MTYRLPNRDDVRELRFLNDKQGNGSLFFLPFCQTKVDKHPLLTTKEWLIAKRILKDKTAIQADLIANEYQPITNSLTSFDNYVHHRSYIPIDTICSSIELCYLCRIDRMSIQRNSEGCNQTPKLLDSQMKFIHE